MASGFAKRVNSYTCPKSDKAMHRRRTLTPPAAPLPLFKAKRGGGGCDKRAPIRWQKNAGRRMRFRSYSSALILLPFSMGRIMVGRLWRLWGRLWGHTYLLSACGNCGIIRASYRPNQTLLTDFMGFRRFA
jgi:hypothetical protein